jgi:PleD family two-component response regulator
MGGSGETSVDLSAPSVRSVCESALDAVRALPLVDPEGETFRLTASIGLAELAGGGIDDALDEARRLLFRAGDAGHNRVVAHDDDAETDETRILVAEDDEISATILLHRLRKEGLDVTHVDNGREAYERALEDPPDMVILDVKMPGMDGFEVLERLRRTPAFSGVPIIMLTSMGSEADVVRGFQLGADDYVLKPFSPVELSARVWRLLRRGRSATAL